MQTKLKASKPDDKYEREADRIAEEVLREPEEEEQGARRAKPFASQIAPLVQRQIGWEQEAEKGETVQAELAGGLRLQPQGSEIVQKTGIAIHSKDAVGQMPQPDSRLALESLRGGQPLPYSPRRFMESRFGYSFGHVRVHSNAKANKIARVLKARAFTIGHNIAFASGEYSPETRSGRRTLAHELTHVIQQDASDPRYLPSEGPGQGTCPEVVQRLISIAGRDLDAAGITSAQNDIVTTHLTDIVNNTRGDLLFSRRYRENLIRDTVLDIHQASTRFNFGSVEELARDVGQRVLASLYMRQSQGRTKRHMGFSYPDRPSDGTAGVGARVNAAATAYWGPRQIDSEGNYFFELGPTGEANAYQAIVSLFTEQTDPHLRTLIHCDYLLSVLQYRAWAETIGPSMYNLGVSLGLIEKPVLKWNGFADMTLRRIIPSSTFPYFRSERPLEQVTVSSEDDLVIGDHVVFYNHESYDALIEAVGGVWRLENAIVIRRRGGENRYQGHGYFAPVPKERLLAGMIKQYDRHVSAARRLTRAVERATTPAQRTAARNTLHATYPNVHEKVGGGWEISNSGLCGNHVTRDLRRLTMGEAPGLTDPCTGTIVVRRPVYTSP